MRENMSRVFPACIVLSLVLTGCAGTYRERWPEDRRPDMSAVAVQIETDLKSIPSASRISVVVVDNAHTFNSVRVDVDYESTDASLLARKANEIEKRIAPVLVALRDDGTLTVRVQSSDYETMPYDIFYPNSGTQVSWNQLARHYGLKRPNPWSK